MSWRYHFRERLLTEIVWHLPRKIVYWCVVRAACIAEPNYNPGEVTAERMLKTLGS